MIPNNATGDGRPTIAEGSSSPNFYTANCTQDWTHQSSSGIKTPPHFDRLIDLPWSSDASSQIDRWLWYCDREGLATARGGGRMKRLPDSDLAKQLTPILGAVPLFYGTNCSAWLRWDEDYLAWRFEPKDAVLARIANFLDQNSISYSAAKPAAIERLLRLQLGMRGDTLGSRTRANRYLPSTLQPINAEAIEHLAQPP